MKLSFPVCIPDTDETIMAWCQNYEESFPWLAGNGYEGIEMLVRDPAEVPKDQVLTLLQENKLQISAIGTTPMQKKDHLFLLSEDKEIREEAQKRLEALIELGDFFHAPILVGKYRGMQKDADHCRMEDLEEIIRKADKKASETGVTLLIEPQSSDNINNLNTIEETVAWIRRNRFMNVKLLMDIFHMDKTEQSIENSLRIYREYIGMIHMADSKRKVPGSGKVNTREILQTLNKIGYQGFLSMESKQEPDTKSVAAMSARALKDMDGEK